VFREELAAPRNGYNFADRFSMVVATIVALPVRSCLIDVQGVRAYNVLAEELERLGKRY
jgi:hypothetical protein